MDIYQYLTTRRIFIFLDEWLFYLLLLVLYLLKVPYYIIIPLILIGVAMIYYGYRDYWSLLRKYNLEK